MNRYRVYYLDGHGETVIIGRPKGYTAADALNAFFRENPHFANLPHVKVVCEIISKQENRVFHDGVTRTVEIRVPPEEREDCDIYSASML